MVLKQNWVGYLDRSYEQIKASLLKRLAINNPEITDHNESNILIVIVSMFAGVAEMLNLYIDNMAKESFIGTARRYTSMIKLVRLIDYRVKSRISSTANLEFYLVDSNGDLAITPSNILIPKGSVINSYNDLPFVLQEDVTIVGNTSFKEGTAAQYVRITGEIIGNTNGSPGQQLVLPQNYAHNSLTLTINAQEWSLVDSLGFLTSIDKSFIVEFLEDGNAYITFGDGVNGMVPPSGQTIFATYNVTEGALGNLPPNSITDLQNTITVPSGLTLLVTNRDYSSNGADFEGTEEIRNRAPRSIRTLYRAVTRQDFIDLALLAPGVDKAEISHCCGKIVDLYIAPIGRGIATRLLLTNTSSYFSPKKLITQPLNILSAGISRLFIRATLYGSQFATSDQIYNDAVEALMQDYGYDASDINKTIKVSSIVTTLENVESIESLDLEKIYIEPFLRPTNANHVTPNIVFGEISSKTRHDYKVIYFKSTNSYDVYRDGVYIGFAIPGNGFATISSDPLIMTFTIQDNGNVPDLAQYTFTVFPSYPENFPDYSIDVDDYSIPIFDILQAGTDISLPVIFSDLTVVPSVGLSFKKSNC